MKNIATALVKAQKGFSPALKTATNPFFKSKYADLSACVEAVIDSLNDNGIALIQRCSESETGVIVETTFLHESGEMMNCGNLHVPSSKNDPQGYGSALTYARRYSLMAACGIAPEDDDGNAAAKAKKQQIDTKPVSQAHVDGCYDMLKEEVDKSVKDATEPDCERMQKGYDRITNDERMAVMQKFKDNFGRSKIEGTNKMYTTIIKECLAAHPADDEVIEK
jgi:hypothetical protein